MKFFKHLSLTLAAAAALTFGASANATIIYDIVDPSPNITITTSTPLTITHDITDDGFTVGVTPILSAFLDIHLVDYLGRGSETFRITVGGGQVVQCLAGDCVTNALSGQYETIALDPISISDLLADGKINVQLRALSGSYQFADSVLSVNIGGPEDPEEVPEPATLALLALGLLSFGMMRRRMQ